MNTTEYLALQKTIEDLYLNTNDNINSVGYSYKITNDKQTNILSIKFSVNKKKNISELSADEILPKFININGQEYLTDIVEENIDAQAHPCYSWDPPDQSIIQHRSLAPILKGGISVGRPDEISAGTLGLICLDNIDKNIIGLTNNHVIIKNGFLNSSRFVFNPNDPPANTKYVNSDTSDMVQPGRIEGIATQKIGPIKRYYPLSRDNLNYIDGSFTINRSYICCGE